jgi:hypothetical protein
VLGEDLLEALMTGVTTVAGPGELTDFLERG